MSTLIMQYFLNDRLEPAELERQIEELARAGIEGVYPHPRTGMRTPYFSQACWEAIEVIVEACRRHGLEVWIWDEDYWPSGRMGGRILWEDPGLTARGLSFAVHTVSGSGPVELDFGPGLLLRCVALPRLDQGYGATIDVTAHCGTRRQSWGPRRTLHRAYSPLISDVGHPHWRTWMHDNRFALAWRPPHDGEWLVIATLLRAIDGAPDFLRPETIRRFLELTHDEYHRRHGADFGDLIPGFFTDEPSPGSLFPWTPAFPAEFATDHGYDVLEHVHHLAVAIDDRSAVVRHHYRETVGRLLRAHYVEQLHDWCEAHRVQSLGHLTRTEWLSLVAGWWPNELRCYRHLHIPCCDPLGGSIGWPDAAAYHTGVKVASSAAHLFGRAQAGADVLAVIGDEQARIRDLKWLLDYHLVLGLNHFVLHGASYTLAGARKDEVPPPLFTQHSEWRFVRVLWDHVRARAEALTGGEHCCEVAVLYPSTTLGCRLDATCGSHPSLPEERPVHELVEFLLSHQCDFDFIDEITLAESVDAGGMLHTPEPYRTILLPHVAEIGLPAAEALVRYAAAGGSVIAVGELPVALPTGLDSPVANWHAGRVQQIGDYGSLLARLPTIPVEGDGARDVFVLRRRRDGVERTLVVNRRESEFVGAVDGVPVKIAPRGSRLLPDEPPDPEPGAVLADLSGGWRVRFEPNQAPLNYWHVEAPAVGPADAAGKFGLPGFDLLLREADPAGEGEGIARYWCRFMLTGAVPDARLVVEPVWAAGEWRVFVNGRLVTGWTPTRRFGDRHWEASVGELLRGGGTPSLNSLCLETRPGGLRELPYLCGSFRAEWRHGHRSFPFLTASPSEFDVPVLHPWSALGYGTFSGSAVYRREVDCEAAERLVLDLGRVEDVAAVSWDEQPLTVLAWPPYRVELHDVSAGRHQLAIEVTNGPANRVRASGLDAGLLGPVTLCRPTDG